MTVRVQNHKHRLPPQHGQKSTQASKHHHISHKDHLASYDYIRKHWAVLIVAIWLAIGTLTGLALLRTSRLATKNAVTIQILHTTYDRKGQYPFVPGTNYEYVIIDVTIANKTSDTFNLAPVLQSYLTDEKGTKYEMAPTILRNPLAAGRLANGVSTTGTLSYVVPQHSSHLTFHFVADSPQHVRYQHTLPREQ